MDLSVISCPRYDLVNKQLILAAFYHFTYQHDSKDLIFATINLYFICILDEESLQIGTQYISALKTKGRS